MAFGFKTSDEDSISVSTLLQNLRASNLKTLWADGKAGFNVAMLSFPITMAYAMIAGLPIYFGIFGSIISGLFSMFFSRSKYVIFGPSNATAVMLMTALASENLTDVQKIAATSAIVFLVGVFLILSSIFKLTNVISYVSRTVITAYITAAALLIIANQLKNVLGFDYNRSESPETFLEVLYATYNHINVMHWQPLAVALSSLIILVLIKKFLPKLPAEAIVMAVLSFAIYLICEFTNFEVSKLTAVNITSWNFALPDFSVLPLRSTIICAFALALLCTLEEVSIGKNFAAKSADRFATNQEVFSLGAANLACSLGSGMTASGSLARSVLANLSGSKTTLVNLFSTLFTLILLFAFGGLLDYVPKATLAMVVIYAGYKLISIKNIKIALRSTKSDAIVFLLTLITGLTSSLDDAIYLGVGASIVMFIKKAANPEVVEYAFCDDGNLSQLKDKSARPDPEISIVHIEGNMFFGASDVLQNQLRRISNDENLKILILKLRNAINIDATTIMDLEELSLMMKKSNRILMLCEVKPAIMKSLKKSGILKRIDESLVFKYTDENPTLSTALALRKAKEYLKGQEPKITIFAKEEPKC